VALAKITPEQAKSLPAPASRKVDFVKEIKPIFEASCIKCHGRGRTKGDLSIESRETLIKGGESGPAIIPGKSEESHLIELVAGLDPDSVMPQKGKRLTPEQIGLLRAWIDQGAQWSEEEILVTFSIAPAVGFVTVKGNEAKFREHWWQRDRWRGGVESFELTESLSKDARLTLEGRALTDDYRVNLLAEKPDLGFTRFGFEQFRKYDSDTGGYVPTFSHDASRGASYQRGRPICRDFSNR